MQNKTDIINAALQRCGAAGINLAFQDTQEAAVATAAYDRCRKLMLAQYSWSFAEKYANLAQDSEAQPFGYRYSFSIPGDCVMVIDAYEYEVDEDGSHRDRFTFQSEETDWDIVGKSIVSNSETMAIRYVSDVETSMPEGFANALAWRLAFEVAPYLQQGTNQAEFFYQMYQQALDEAKVDNDTEINPERPQIWKGSEHISARFTRMERW